MVVACSIVPIIRLVRASFWMNKWMISLVVSWEEFQPFSHHLDAAWFQCTWWCWWSLESHVDSYSCDLDFTEVWNVSLRTQSATDSIWNFYLCFLDHSLQTQVIPELPFGKKKKIFSGGKLSHYFLPQWDRSLQDRLNLGQKVWISWLSFLLGFRKQLGLFST